MAVIEIDIIKKHADAFDIVVDPNRDEDVVLSQGSTRSGKSFNNMLLFIEYCMINPKAIVTCYRKEAATIRDTLWTDFKEAFAMYQFTSEDARLLEQPMICRFTNGSIIKFKGCDTPLKAHGKKQDIAFIDEVIEFRYDVYLQIKQRTNLCMVLAFNPSLTKHWVFNLKKSPKTIYVHSTWRDNQDNLSQVIVDQILSYNPNVPENIKNGTADEWHYKIYDLGVPCAKEGAIFTNWEESNFFPDFEGEDRTYGIDWGFEHPMALVEYVVYEGISYARTLIYEKNLTLASQNPDEDTLVKRMEEMNISKQIPIICDSAYPSNIETVRRMGFQAYGVNKPPGSVIAGINIMKARKFITPYDDPLSDEVEGYVWATKPNGVALDPPQPIKLGDDALDAVRYVCYWRHKNAVEWEKNTQSRGNKILRDRDIKKRFGRNIKTRRR